MRMNALGANLPTVLSGGCSGSLTARAGRWNPRTNAPASPLCRTARREGERARRLRGDIGSLLCLAVARGALDRLADADIGAAAADVSCHRRVDVRIIRVWRVSEQSRRRHDLTRLAIAALDDFQIQPGLLYLRSAWIGAHAFDRGDGAVADRTDRQQARADRLAVDMHRASAALRNAAAEFGAGHTQHVAQHPQQRSIAVDVDVVCVAVDFDGEGHGIVSFTPVVIERDGPGADRRVKARYPSLVVGCGVSLVRRQLRAREAIGLGALGMQSCAFHRYFIFETIDIAEDRGRRQHPAVAMVAHHTIP